VNVYRLAAMTAAVVATLTGCDATRDLGAEATNDASADTAGQAVRVSELPLRRGFYVASDTPCEQASNATLLLLRGKGINGARDFCDFERIDQTRSNVYRTIQSCTSVSDDAAVEQSVTYTLQGDSTFALVSDSGWTASFRYCEQAALPEFWRDIDLSDVLAPPDV
jgi:hypothetical protein